MPSKFNSNRIIFGSSVFLLPCDQTISLLPLSVAKARARAARAAETTATKTATAVTATEGETNLYLKEYIVCYIYVQTANLFFLSFCPVTDNWYNL